MFFCKTCSIFWIKSNFYTACMNKMIFIFRIRKRTYERLWTFVGQLGQSLKSILDLDQLAPVLSDPHFESLDRRLKTILAAIDVCFDENGEEKVLLEVL